jgi:molybdopterin-synthase adenylyltransferase
LKHLLFILELEKIARSCQKYPFPCVSSSSLMQLAASHDMSFPQAQSLALENKILPERYLRNFSSIDLADQKKLTDSRVLLVGLGGLGGYILEILGRSGTGSFILADGDIFEESNLNRQLLGTVDTIGKSKVEVARTRLEQINPFCQCQTIPRFLARGDLPGLMKNADLVVDALGGVEFRQILLEETAGSGLPLVTGFVAGKTGLASTVYPGGKNPSAFWKGRSEDAAENRLGNLASIVSLIASIQSAEVINILTGKKSNLADKVFLADFETLTFDLLEL